MSKAKNNKSVFSDAAIIKLMREGWEKKLAKLTTLDEFKVNYKQASGAEHNVLSKGLKLKHKESGLLYTVIALGAQDIVIKSTQGEELTVNHKTIEQEYELE